MAKYARFLVSFWGDPDVRGLPVNVKLAYIWAFTNSKCGISGMYVMDDRLAVIETGLTKRQWNVAWTALLAHEKRRKGHLVEYDEETGVVWIVGRFKQETMVAPDKVPSPKTVAGGLREVHDLPWCPLHDLFRRKYSHILKDHPWGFKGDPPSASSAASASPHQKEKKRSARSKGKRGRESRAAATGLSKGDLDKSPAGYREAQETIRGLLAMLGDASGAGDTRRMLLELKPVGIYRASRMPLFEHPDRNAVKKELARTFSGGLVESIYIRSPQ